MREINEPAPLTISKLWIGGVLLVGLGMLLGRVLFPIEVVVERRVELPAKVVLSPDRPDLRPTAPVVRTKARSEGAQPVGWESLSEGMSEAQVISLLGPPLRKEQVGQTRTYWYYGAGTEVAYVDFFAGVVHQWKAEAR